jgi:DsbC/DsbD-like thiol-disulfide interchange protein
MNCCRRLKILFLILLVSYSLRAQQTDFLKLISGSAVTIDENTSHLRLIFEIEPGLHIQTDQPDTDMVIPTRIKLKLPGELAMQAPRFPQPETMYLEGSDQPLQVFSGRFEVAVPIKHLEPPQGPNLIAGTIYYQACNNKRCFYPRELAFEISLME